ncbi:MAG: hypothetical protein AMXMBFR7_44200 [Planctomycetota bacterium]
MEGQTVRCAHRVTLALLILTAFTAHGETLTRLVSYEPDQFTPVHSHLVLGRDGYLYVWSWAEHLPNHILRLSPDGRERGSAPVRYALNAVGVNAQGRAVSVHQKWNDQFLAFHTRPFDEHVRVKKSFSLVEAGRESGDFYFGAGTSIVRIAPDGAVLKSFSVPHAINKHQGIRFRVSEKQQCFYLLGNGEVEVVGFDGKKKSKVPTSIGAGQLSAANDSGGFDVDETGLLYVMGSQAHAVKRNSVADELFGAQEEVHADLVLQKEDVFPPGEEKYAVNGIRVGGGKLYVKRRHPSELFQVYDLKTGKLLHRVFMDFARVSATYPSSVWTAGEAVPFEIAVQSPLRPLAPRWRVQVRPFGGPEFRELAWKSGKLEIPNELQGFMHLRVSTLAAGLAEQSASEFALHGAVEIRPRNAAGSVTVNTPSNRVYFGRGEAITFSVHARGTFAGVKAIKLALHGGGKTWTAWAVELKSGESKSLSIESSLSSALAEGSYEISPQAEGLTPVSQSLVIGPGMRALAVCNPIFGDFGNSFQTPGSIWTMPESAAWVAHYAQRTGFNRFYDRIGYPSPEGYLALDPKRYGESLEKLRERLEKDPLAAAPTKAEFASPLKQALAAYSAYGFSMMAILTGMDCGLPLGSQWDLRKSDVCVEHVKQMVDQLKEYPAFRGFCWASNWWVSGRGAGAGKTPEEKESYKQADEAARNTGAWAPILDTLGDRRLRLAVDAQEVLGKAMREGLPQGVSANTPPFRNVECYAPVTFSNVEEVNLFGQFEQVGVPYSQCFEVDFYGRPGKPAISHTMRGNAIGTGDHFVPAQFQALMRGAAGVGSYDVPPGWGWRAVDPREGMAGVLTGWRRVTEFTRRYGAWLREYRPADPIAIYADHRMLKLDRWHKITGVHFARLMEAYCACLHLHRPATFVYTEDLGPETLKRFKAVFVVGQNIEFSPGARAALDAAQSAGVHVFHDETCRKELVQGFTPLGVGFDDFVKNNAVAGDDWAFRRMPNEVRALLPVLKQVLDAKLPPLAEVGDDEVWVSEHRRDQGRMLFVCNNSTVDLSPSMMYRISLYMCHRIPLKLPVKWATEGGVTYELFAQRAATMHDGALEADLRYTPARIFVWLPVPIASVSLQGPARAQGGQALAWSVGVLDEGGKPIPAPVPVEIQLRTPNGNIRATSYFASNAPEGVRGEFILPLDAAPGTWSLEAIETLSGHRTVLPLEVQSAELPMTANFKSTKAPADAQGKPTTPAPHEPYESAFGAHPRAVALSSDGKTALVNTFNWDHNIYTLDLESGSVTGRARVGHYFSFSPVAAGSGFAVQGYDLNDPHGYHVYLLDSVAKPERRFAGYGLPGRGVFRFLPAAFLEENHIHAVAPDGSWIAVAGNLGLAVYARDGKLLWKQDWSTDAPDNVRLAAPNPKTLLMAREATLETLDAVTGKPLGKVILAVNGKAREIAYSLDGSNVAVATSTSGGRVYVLRAGKLVATLPTDSSELRFSPDGTHVLITHRNLMEMHAVESGLCWSLQGDQHLRHPTFSTDGKRIAVSSDLGTLYVLSVEGETLLARDEGEVGVPAFLAGGDLFLAGWMGRIQRFDAQYKVKWESRLHPEAPGMRGKLIEPDATPTARVEGWTNSVETQAALAPNLLIPGTSKLTFEGLKPSKDLGLLCDGKPESPGVFFDWGALNTHTESSEGWVFLTLQIGPKAETVSGVTLHEAADYPDSWVRDFRFDWYDDERKVWKTGPRMLSNAAVHTHRLAKPETTTRIRLGFPKGIVGNLRLGEIVIHGKP